MAKSLPSRPNLDHLRKQAKTLLADVRDGRASAIRAFKDHLPAAKALASDAIVAAGFRLADAQLVVARQSGFGSWPGLARYVEQLRGLEGEWRFERLQVDGNLMPAAVIANSRLLIDGDRFRTESADANYDGVFTIDVEFNPSRIDIEFIEGPEAGSFSFGLFELDGDRLTLCLNMAPGGRRPSVFGARRGSGYALERLRRVSAGRPATVTGGTRGAVEREEQRTADAVDAAAFDVPMTPLLRRLQGDWTPVELVMDGKPMPKEWLAYGLRTMSGNEMKVVFNGQTMAHARVRVHEDVTPIAVDYLNLHGRQKGSVSFGVMDWMDDELRILMSAPGDRRPANFETVAKTATLSRWRRK